MTHTNSYAIGLDRNPANYTPLTPIGFLERAARVYPDRIAMIHGDWQATWKETYSRCRRLASASNQARHRQRRHRGADGAQRAGHL